jgi:CDP-glycerol glycerophosphotransferase
MLERVRRTVARVRTQVDRATGRGTAPGQASVARRLAQRLRVVQDGDVLHLDVLLRDGTDVHGLWLRSPDSATWWQLPDPEVRPLRDRAGAPVHVHADLDLAEVVRTTGLADGQEATLHLYLDVAHDVLPGSPEADDVPLMLESTLESQPGGRSRARYRVRVGKAGRSDVGPLHPVDIPAGTPTSGPDGTPASTSSVLPYVSRGGYVTLAVNREARPYGDVYVHRISVDGGRLRLGGLLLTRHGDLQHAELLLKGRTSGLRVALPVRFTLDEARTRQHYGHHYYRFSADGDWGALLEQGQLADDVVDAWMTFWTAQAPEPFDVRIGKTRFVTRTLTRASWVARGDRAAVITPYYTFKRRKTSFQVDLFDTDTLDYLRAQLRRRHLIHLRTRLDRRARQSKPVWLVGERPYKAQDTGLAFFRHLRENHPEIDAYYVIEAGSPEYRNVAPYGNVLKHRSPEHVHAALRAERVLGSHHPDYVYPLRTPAMRRAIHAGKVFLQHGVMGTKWMVPNYGKNIPGFETDLFVVSSEREKQYIVGDFGYDPDEVVVTGLSRFDTLLDDDEPPPARRQLLIMPTWRDWLQDADLYADSEYHERWWQLLHDPRLRRLAEQHDLDVVFCLHPNMQAFTPMFSGAPARVISQGEVDVQRLLKQSALLVTDYSSVGFDFSFLHKPVLYYQFDQQRFLGREGSHLDLDAELPGPILYSADEVLTELERAAADGFVMPSAYVRRADRFLTYRDRRSSERIFEAARDLRRRRSLLERVESTELYQAGYRQLRRSRLYFPAMRAMVRLLQRLPADENRVVFESGVGLQYADSPRYVSEELVRRGSQMMTVWAYTGKIHSHDQNTVRVARMSPEYFWHLGRAKYWVNNQNFPSYLKRRPDGVYLQTWHGTPLKRMLHDLATIHGRDGGYVERVTEAARQWSVLASPSPYATAAMRSAFRYTGDVVEQGYPRNDVFFRPDADDVARRVRRKLGISQDATVVLYAPTFRDDQPAGANRFSFALPLDLERFTRELGPDVVLLLRMHVLIRGGAPVPDELADRVVDVSSYPEIQELFLASDALVTDYSSVFFDYAALRRPMVFYAYDLEAYRDRLRGFYLDYSSDLPGPVVTTEGELYAALADLDGVAARYSERYDAFLERFAPHDDGHAAERVVDAVFAEAISRGAVPPALPEDEPASPSAGDTVAGTTLLGTPVGAEVTVDEQTVEQVP